MPKWVLPAVVLVLLLGVYAARWDTITVREGQSVTTFRTDRWTGQTWEKLISTYGVSPEHPLPFRGSGKKNPRHPYKLRNSLTIAWGVLTGLVVGWLLYEVRPTQKRRKYIARPR